MAHLGLVRGSKLIEVGTLRFAVAPHRHARHLAGKVDGDNKTAGDVWVCVFWLIFFFSGEFGDVWGSAVFFPQFFFVWARESNHY